MKVLDHQDSIVLPAMATSAGEGRRFVAATLESWGLSGCSDLVVLLVSELVANVALHARTEAVLALSHSGGRLRAQVCDHSPQLPVRRHYGLASSTGRGILLLETLASEWGVEPRADGKCVWFVVDTTPVPTGLVDFDMDGAEPL